MQVIGKRPGHEFDFGLSEWAGNMFGVPTHVNSDLAHGKIGRESVAVCVHHGFKTKAATNLGCAADPIVALFHSWFRDVPKVKISATPKTIGFRFQCFVDKAAGDGGAGAV